jgi:hypothetical protein
MRALSRDFVADTDTDSTLGRVTEAAVALIDGIEYADVMLVTDGAFRSVAPTDPVVSRLDGTQMEHGAGPCLDAAVEDSIIRSDDLELEQRWPQFTAEALAAGIRAVLSFQLVTFRGGRGALNLFGRGRDCVDAEGVALGAMLATHAAVVLMTSDRNQQFQSALASRDVIGQAKGVLMVKFAVDAVRAFDLMVRQSQSSNTPLRVVAQEVVDAHASLVDR